MRLTFFTILLTCSLFSQQKEPKDYLKDYLDKIKSGNTFNSKTLNVVFAYELGNYDLDFASPSSQEFNAYLSNEDESITLGYSVDKRNGDISKYLKHNFKVGLKVFSENSDKFYSFLDSEKKLNGFGIVGAYNFFFTGFLKFDREVSSEVQTYRDTKLLKVLKEKMKDNPNINDEKVESFIAESEASFLRKKKNNIGVSKFWFSTNFFIPFNNLKTYVSESEEYQSPSEFQFRPWDLNLGINFFKSYGNWSFIVSGNYGVFNNNNVLTNELKMKKYVALGSVSNGYQSINTKEHFVGTYKDFITNRFRLEGTSLLLKNALGISFAVEKNIGEYNKLNWKLGLPLSIKDSKGKSSVNFEFQWKEVNNNHFIGISVGKSFGKFFD